jgi:geranylgeranyl reductase family protein
MDWDVIIAGGGIGGAAAAYFLSGTGCRVAVFEKQKLPRYKACAGGVSKGAQKLLPFSLAPVVETEVTEVVFSLRQEEQFTQSLGGESTLMVKRAALDHYVLCKAQAEVIESTSIETVEEQGDRVRVRTQEGKCYEARYLIGADGANSQVAKCLHLRRNKPLGIAVEMEAPGTPELLERYRHCAWFEFGGLGNGYLWVFPKSDVLSVGIGSFGKTSVNLLARLKTEMARLGLPLDGLPWRAHPLPIHLRAETVGTPRCMLVGDAAGLVDAFLGEGIRYAIHSGRLAAEAILHDTVSNYSAMVKTQISDGLRRARFAAWVFYNHPDLSYTFVKRNYAFTRAFMKLLDGSATYRDLSICLPLSFVQSLFFSNGNRARRG